MVLLINKTFEHTNGTIRDIAALIDFIQTEDLKSVIQSIEVQKPTYALLPQRSSLSSYLLAVDLYLKSEDSNMSWKT